MAEAVRERRKTKPKKAKAKTKAPQALEKRLEETHPFKEESRETEVKAHLQQSKDGKSTTGASLSDTKADEAIKPAETDKEPVNSESKQGETLENLDTGQGESKGLAESVPDAELEAKDCDVIETVDISKDTQKESFSTDVDSGAIEEKAVIPDSELEQTETSGFTEQISEIVPDEDGACSEGKTERKDGAMGESKVVYVEEDTKIEREEGAVGESKVVYVEEDTKTEGEEGAVSESKVEYVEEDTKTEGEEGAVGGAKVVCVEEITKSDSKNFQNVVEAAPRLITDMNRPAVSEQEVKPHVMQQHLYPDLRKDIERMKAEEEQTAQSVLTKPHEQQAEHLKERAVESDKVTQKKVEERENVAQERVEERGSVAQKRMGESETVAPKRVVEKETVAQKRIEEKGNIQPLTLEQLNSLYYNPKLEQNDTFIDNFIEREQKKDSHEFYEIIQNYQRARRNLLQAESALQCLEAEYGVYQAEVWITEESAATVKGTCGDGSKCTGTHSYERTQLNQTALNSMKKTLEGLQEQIETKLSLHSYSAQLSRLQVESYIHDLFVTSPALRDIPKNLPVYGCERQSPDIVHQIVKLRDCITVLFNFHRQPTEDGEFLKNLESWTERLASALLRISTFDDHLFILNHVLRCPAGVGSWAAQLIQVPAIPSNQELVALPFGNQYLDHLVTCLSTLLIPTRSRDKFLVQMQKMFTPDPNTKGISWIMVDSDGEEDEDPQNAWMYLHENDIVAILKQLPMAAIFRHVFFVTQSQFQERWEYDISRTSESALFRLFAFCTCLVRLLGLGLETYNKARYRQLNKRLGRMIRQTVQYVSDHWESFQQANQGRLSSDSHQRLQAEFDSFFLRAVSHIYESKRLGCWQFIADMPFSNVSKATMWKLLWLLHQSHGKMVDVSSIPPVEKCIQFIQDPESRKQLSDILQFVPVSEGIYLLNTMTNMIECCSPANTDLINAVTLAVFEVSYLCPETRDSCAKMGRELLSAVVISHPFIVSLLTEKVYEAMEQIGTMGLYLFSGLPLTYWLPSDPYLVIVRQWLLNSNLGSATSQLAQLILVNINWGTTHMGDKLMVPWNVHKQVALLVVEAYQKFILGRNLGSLIMEGVKQVTAAVQQHSTNDQEFNSWCWDLLLKLSLHRSCLPKDDQRLADAQGGPPNLHKDDSLLPLVKGIKDRNPTACCIALLMSSYGHNTTEFLAEGIPLLQALTDQGLFKAVLCVINYVVPLFYGYQDQLLKNESMKICHARLLVTNSQGQRQNFDSKSASQALILDFVSGPYVLQGFLDILHLVLQADESYFKVVKGFMSYDFPGPITKLLINMIQSQVSLAEDTSKEMMILALSIWTKLVMRLPKWFNDRNCCCVLDSIIESAFTFTPAMNNIYLLIQEEYKKFCQEEKSHGVVSSLVNWVTSGVTLPSFIEKYSYPECSWLMYMILTMENQFERDTTLWPSMQDELLENPKMGIDQSLKKLVAKLKLDQAPTMSRLSIYRLAQQALDMSYDHPVAVLTWQKFFVCYLGRVTATASLPQRASIGERFFTGMSYSSMLKKMKKRLGESADYYTKQASDNRDQEEEDRDPRDNEATQQMNNKLARIFRTFQLWLEEPLLHDASLYLPSLPQQYHSDRLLLVFQNQTAPWLEFLNIKAIKDKMVTMATSWLKTGTPEQNPKASPPADPNKKMTAEQRIISRLARCELPLPPPPIHNIKAPVPDISTMIVEDKAAILHLLEADLNVLTDYARQFCNRIAQHSSLDHIYLELVPQLYQNVTKQVTVSLQCTSMINPLHKCSKPGSAIIQIEEKWNDQIIQRQADENRAEYKQLLIESKLPPAQNVVTCAVHTENAITLLVKLFRACTDQSRAAQLNSTAFSLFFRLAEIVTDNTQRYPPTNQFFSSCIEILGQEFIHCDPSQTESVLQMALGKPMVAGLMAPHFIPNLSPQMYVSMYEKLMKTLQGGSPELTFMLLTKFDVRNWLNEYSPSKSEVKEFINILSHAFISCGAEPDTLHQQVLELYLGHERRLLSYKFPLYLHEVIAAVLQGSSIKKLNIRCWEVLHSSCFQMSSAATESAQLAVRDVDIHTDLSTDQVRNLLLWFAREFTQIRENKKDILTFGLYPTWQRYIPHVSMYLRDLAKCFVDKMTPSLAEAASNEGIEVLWRQIVEAFIPWIQTFFIKSGIHVPWIESDKVSATIMVQALCDVVYYAHNKTSEIRGKFYSDFLSLLWLYFVNGLCKPQVPNDVVAIYNMEFVKLPWQQLMPNMHVMESMAMLKENGNVLGFNLVADIVALVNWNQVVQWYEAYHPQDVKSSFERCLFLLFIQAFAEKKHVENPDMEHVLVQAETYSWQHLTPDAYKSSCSWLLQGCDPKCLLVERSSPDAIGLRILKSAACFTTQASASWNEVISMKRLSYLHCVASLLCQCTFLQDCDMSGVEKMIINLLTEIETVESAIPDNNKQQEESRDMMKEMLTLLNNSNPDGNSSAVVMATIIQWFHDSPQTILLVPCIHAASRCLASLTHLTQLEEECIQLYFVSAKQNNDTDPWSTILAFLQFPELGLTEFFNACIQEGSYLLLHCYVLQRVPLCQSLVEEQGVIEIILDWTERVKPTAENESKLLLWWFKALALILRQIDYGRDRRSCVALVRKIANKVQGFGEDRAHVGLLGAIGLGKKSALSEKFRLTCRALSTYCNCQVISDNQLRLEPTSPPSNLPITRQEVGALLSLKTNKKYQAIKTDVEMICEFVLDPNKCIGNVMELLHMSKALFYSDMEYLSVM